jgi:hypothetical protein
VLAFLLIRNLGYIDSSLNEKPYTEENSVSAWHWSVTSKGVDF